MSDLDTAQRGSSARRDTLLVASTVAAVLVVVGLTGFLLQGVAQRGAVTTGGVPAAGQKERRELDKLTAEISQIRSDTAGSLYWLKLAAVFVTVGSAVGGYLVAQTRSSRERVAAEEAKTKMRIDFERRVQVDNAFGAIVRELSAEESALLRATAAMKLGKLLQAPPVEWHLEQSRRDELWSLTKQILAASLAIESDEKVLKALTIAVALHAKHEQQGNLRGLDFSLARAADAYWARVDFTDADFYRADLSAASLRRATLAGAQFRETVLSSAVLAQAVCAGANFKLADLRGADFTGADLTGATFDRARVHGARFTGATFAELDADDVVDIAADGDEADYVAVVAWAAGVDAA